MPSSYSYFFFEILYFETWPHQLSSQARCLSLPTTIWPSAKVIKVFIGAEQMRKIVISLTCWLRWGALHLLLIIMLNLKYSGVFKNHFSLNNPKELQKCPFQILYPKRYKFLQINLLGRKWELFQHNTFTIGSSSLVWLCRAWAFCATYY